MDYLACLQATWQYLPYLCYTFVFLTLLPKSLSKIKAFAAANYATNRTLYHRCYGPDQCCHTLPKPKQRKAVTRVYPKRQNGGISDNTVQQREAPPRRPSGANICSSLSANHVNEIAKMFESGGRGGAAAHARRINRVTPTILCEANASSVSLYAQQSFQGTNYESASSRTETIDAQSAANCCSSASTQKRQRNAPNTLSFSNGTSATPSSSSESPNASCASPAPSADFSPHERCMPLKLKSSLEDIFAAIARNAESGCCTVGAGVSSDCCTSIDDILSQRRLSRPLSAYSISDLLNEESVNQQQQQQCRDEVFMESFLRTLNNKT